MKGLSLADGRKLLAPLAMGALLLSTATIPARADSDGIVNGSNVPVPAVSSTGLPECPAAHFTPSSFSFDISWVDSFARVYLLADRTHGGTSTVPAGAVMVMDLNAINFNSPNATNQGITYLTPPPGDAFAGIRCDANAAFGGTGGAGRNELTGPDGVFSVNHTEAWLGDGPKFFALPSPETNTAADYVNDGCDSSVRVFNLITGKQTDHINVGGCFRTDEGAFDPKDQVAIFANPSEQPLPGNHHATALNNSPFVTLISTVPVAPGKHHKILKQINFDGTHGTYAANGGIEQAVYSPKTGLFYVAVPGNSTDADNGVVAVIDPRGDADDIHFVRNFHLKNCSPNGAALGPDFELFLGCSGAFPEQVIDIRNGHLIATAAGTNGGCDEVDFNAGDNHFVGACTGTTATGTDALDVVDADPVNHDISIDTKTRGAHSVAADPVTVQNFMPATSGTGANAGGLCGPTPCILLFGSTGGDDPSEFQQEAREHHHHDFDRHDDDND
ncbi:MAG TPA: hypothetical protein VJR47_06425 [Stellaceae bacterium]|nr:hypothetical protein [Stellaceae bacterium]